MEIDRDHHCSKRVAYFDYACFGPMRAEVLSLTSYWVKFSNTLGPQSKQVLDSFVEGLPLEVTARERCARWSGIARGLRTLAALFDKTPESILTARNTTQGISRLVKNLVYGGSRAILCPAEEHPVILDELSRIARRSNIAIERFVSRGPRGKFDMQRFVDAARTLCESWPCVLVVSHVMWDTGEIIDLCRLSSVIRSEQLRCDIVVDGAHGLGQLPLDDVPWDDIVGYVGSGHKWLRGPVALGVLCVPKKSVREPYLDAFGADYFTWPGRFLEEPSARTQQCPSVALEKLIGTCAAAEILLREGIDRVRKRSESWRNRIIRHLHEDAGLELGAEVDKNHAGIINVPLLNSAVSGVQLAAGLSFEFNVLVGAWHGSSGIRISVPFDTRPTDARRLVAGMIALFPYSDRSPG